MEEIKCHACGTAESGVYFARGMRLLCPDCNADSLPEQPGPECEPSMEDFIEQERRTRG